MLAKILIGIALVLALFLAVAAFQPAHFKIERSATIAAPPATVFPHVNDFHRWEAWSPWAKLDPAMKTTYAGSPAGTGAVYSWAGDSKVGEGRMTLTDSRPNDRITIKLEFLKPFAATNTTEFIFRPSADQTAVTWTMSGEKDLMSKAFGLFVNMDKMIGADFEKGLAQLKAVAESTGAKK